MQQLLALLLLPSQQLLILFASTTVSIIMRLVKRFLLKVIAHMGRSGGLASGVHSGMN